MNPTGQTGGPVRGLVVALLGPTGVGKTAVATVLARRLDAAVISCDSMQVYRGFPVLTNQPGEGERREVRHELVGIVDPSAEFSAAQYASLARPLIEKELQRCGVALVVGGTGLYLRAAVAPLAVSPAADPGLRLELEARAAVEGPGVLHEELARLDPTAAAAIDARNLRRVIRALEVVLRTGTRWSGRQDLWEPEYFHPTLLVGLTLERQELYRRIDARARLIVEGGAVEEVRAWRRGAPSERDRGGIAAAIGYPEIARLLDGLQSEEETVEQIAAATRRYARRQLTWLRKMSDLVIIDAQDRAVDDVASSVAALVTSAHVSPGHVRSNNGARVAHVEEPSGIEEPQNP